MVNGNLKFGITLIILAVEQIMISKTLINIQMLKFVQSLEIYLKTRDAAMQAAALDYRANPTNPAIFSEK